MKLTPKVLFVSTFIGLLSMGGLARIVFAKPSTVAIVSQHPIHTLIANATQGESPHMGEDSHLRSLAKITPEQAQQSAERAMGAKASHVELENDEGDLVYSVQIGKAEVKVDAGTGKVLYTEDHNSENEEKAHPHSSIRLSEGANGDGDGETNDDDD